MADLSLVLQRGEHVGSAKQLDVSFWAVAPDLLEEVFEPNHGNGV
jgi:hypothetical protein